MSVEHIMDSDPKSDQVIDHNRLDLMSPDLSITRHIYGAGENLVSLIDDILRLLDSEDDEIAETACKELVEMQTTIFAMRNWDVIAHILPKVYSKYRHIDIGLFLEFVVDNFNLIPVGCQAAIAEYFSSLDLDRLGCIQQSFISLVCTVIASEDSVTRPHLFIPILKTFFRVVDVNKMLAMAEEGDEDICTFLDRVVQFADDLGEEDFYTLLEEMRIIPGDTELEETEFSNHDDSVDEN